MSTPLLPDAIQHAAAHRDHDRIYQVVRIQLLLDALQVHPYRALADTLRGCNLLDELTHCPAIENGLLTRRQQWTRARSLQSPAQ